MRCNGHVRVLWTVMAFLWLAESVQGDVILMPDRVEKLVWVLDSTTGDVRGSFDISGFAVAPTEVIDGPGSMLLMSDQVANEVFRLSSTGEEIGVHLAEKADGIRGIYLMKNGTLVGATSHALRAWDVAGNPLTFRQKGDFYDVLAATPAVLAACAVDDENVKGFSTDNGRLMRETGGGELHFPHQIAMVDSDEGARLAACALEGKSIHLFRKDGSTETSFSISDGPRGIIQLDSGNLLISTTAGLVEYTVEGTYVRTVMAGTGFWFLNRSEHYRFN